MNVSRTLVSLKQSIQNYVFGVFSCMKQDVWCMFNYILLFLTCNTNTKYQGHSIGPINLHNLQKIHSQQRRNTTASQKKNRMQTWTEKYMKSYIHTSAKTYRNRKQVLFKNCVDIRLPCEHWTNNRTDMTQQQKKFNT